MADPTQTNISQTSIPDYARPYVENLLGRAQAVTQTPYKSYPGERTADFTGMQNQAFTGAQNLGPASQLGTATNMAQQAGIGALNTQYGPSQYGNQYGYSPQQVSAQGLNNYQMSGPQQVGTQQFTGDQVGQYMNPYLQNALQPQLQEMQRQYDITGTQEAGNATRQGAFGGSRQAIMQAENQRNKNMAMNQAIGQGYNTAYTNAANQFNTSQGQNLQAQMANQGAGLTTGTQNLNALLGVQNLGANQNMQAQLANQQAGLTSAQTGAQYGQAANQLNEQSRQYGAGLGLQGLQTGLQAAGALGNLGASQFGQQTQALGIQNQMGGQQQQQQQNILNQQYQDFLNQKQYPYQQLGFMSDTLRGLPLSQTSSAIYSNPSMLSQVAGLGLTGAAMANSKLFGAKGGLPKDFEKKKNRPAGLAELALSKMA